MESLLTCPGCSGGSTASASLWNTVCPGSLANIRSPNMFARTRDALYQTLTAFSLEAPKERMHLSTIFNMSKAMTVQVIPFLLPAWRQEELIPSRRDPAVEVNKELVSAPEC
jgi:hypothetical protein